MNRRDFLTTLLAIGGAAVIPFKAVEAASDAAVDQAWSALQLEPKVFYVDDWGRLSTLPGVEGVHIDLSRRELLALDEPPETPAELAEYIRTTWGLEDEIETCFNYSDVKDDEECTYKSWEDWLMAEGHPEIRQAVEDWLNGDPDDNDYASANLHGTSGQGYALYFFMARTEICDLLGILLPKAPNPASFEFAAHLNKNIEEANALLAENAIPIRFEDGL